jgi:hypothetical protein
LQSINHFFFFCSFLVLLKLFIGMGLMWTFEIIAGLIDFHNRQWIW